MNEIVRLRLSELRSTLERGFHLLCYCRACRFVATMPIAYGAALLIEQINFAVFTHPNGHLYFCARCQNVADFWFRFHCRAPGFSDSVCRSAKASFAVAY